MTRLSIASTRSSMPDTLDRNQRDGHYSLPAWITASAKAMSCTPATAQVRAFYAQQWTEIFLENMVAHGNTGLAEQRLTRLEALLCRETPELFTALRAVSEPDAKEDMARDTYLDSRTPESLSLLERTTIQEVVTKLALLRSIRALKRETRAK